MIKLIVLADGSHPTVTQAKDLLMDYIETQSNTDSFCQPRFPLMPLSPFASRHICYQAALKIITDWAEYSGMEGWVSFRDD